MGENQQGKQWWEVSRFVPEGKMDIVLLTCGGAAVFFLILTIVGFSTGSSRGARPAAAGVKSPATDEMPADVTARIEGLENDLEKAKGDLEASQQKVKELSEKLGASGSLSGQMERVQKEKEALEKRMETLSAEKQELAEAADSRAAEITDLRAEKKRLERAAAAAEALRKERDGLKETLDQKEQEIAELRSAERNGAAETARLKRDGEVKIAGLENELAESLENLDALKAQLADFPPTPLSGEEAKRRYEETKAGIEAIEINDIIPDHDKRIAAWLMAKRVLAGTDYERNADSDWEREKKLKQVDIDNAAVDLHKKTLDKIKEHAEEYDLNIKMLSDILDDVNMKESPRNIKAVEGSIARQEQAKQAAFDRAAGEVYKEVLARNREDREAYDEHIRQLQIALAKVQNSPRYIRIIEGAIEKEKKLKAAAEARAGR